MLIGVKEKLEDGMRVPITLVFEKAGERTIEAVVKK
jgi:copper(I)-binding protein